MATRSAWLSPSTLALVLLVTGVSLSASAALAGSPPCGGLFFFENLPATGVTTATILGEDGNPPCGQPLSFHDNGDGTITDWNTHLTWEKKDKSSNNPSGADVHNVENGYPWNGTCSNSPSTACGTDDDCSAGGTCLAVDDQGTGLTIFGFVAKLNEERFEGHNNWRVPNIRELDSLVDYGAGTSDAPQVEPAFNGSDCVSTCTDLTSQKCSCTAISQRYWSSTSFGPNPALAWDVFFLNAGDEATLKGFFYHVRAVRGGL